VITLWKLLTDSIRGSWNFTMKYLYKNINQLIIHRLFQYVGEIWQFKNQHIISVYTNHQPETLETIIKDEYKLKKPHNCLHNYATLDLSLNRYHIIITYGTSPPPFHNEGKRELNSLQLHSLHIDCWDTSLSKSKLLRANNTTQSISSPQYGKVYLACNLPPQASIVCFTHSLHAGIMHYTSC
jgi:hypothetical protein